MVQTGGISGSLVITAVFTEREPFFGGLFNLRYPLRDRKYLVTLCERICVHRKNINNLIVLAGQKLGLQEVDGGIWLISPMHDDLGFIDPEHETCNRSTTRPAQGWPPFP